MKKIIGLTYNLKSDWVLNPNDPADASAEFDSPATMERIALALERGGHTIKKIGNIDQLLAKINNLGVDIVFNICEGFEGRNRESQVPMLLELKKIPYVGSDALTLGVTLDKIAAKKMFVADGVPTPRFFNASAHDDLEKLNTIGFPLIVKARYEGTSKGLSDDSRVVDMEGLKKKVAQINKIYHQPALVEEFISGTEFTVAVIGNENPEAMPVAQVSIQGSTELGDKFFTYARVLDEDLRYVCPAKISKEMTQKLQDIAVKAYKSVDCWDFGRVDFRVDSNGNPYVLEINPLPSLAEKDVFNIFPYVMGSTYDETINRVLNVALERHGLLGLSKASLTQNAGQKAAAR